MLEHFQREIKHKIEEGILIIENEHLKIPEKHWFMAESARMRILFLFP
jgi:oxygen-independent coproporphyrinogen-3 oxidase